MRSEEEIRARLAKITAELEGGGKPRAATRQSRLLVLYNRQQALLWVLGEENDGAA